MADIPSNIDKINDSEVAFEASLSEVLFNKIGANINALIDQNTFQEFTSGGTYDIDLEADYLLIAACGAGGSGAGPTPRLTSTGQIQNEGGEGCPLYIQLVPVVGGETATITIPGVTAGGAAGASGVDGGNTIFSTPSNGSVIWYGGKGGQNGRVARTYEVLARSGPSYCLGGYFTTSSFPSYVETAPEKSVFQSSNGNLIGAEAGGGGGGSGSFGPGGNGGNGLSGNGGNSGGDAALTAYGSGGGSGGMISGATPSGTGGDGAPGYLAILRALNV